MTARPFRVIDTGLRDARPNIAFDQALIELHKQGRVPDTIRFLRFHPSALIGRHQVLGDELKLGHCRAQGLQTARRITGGGALLMGPGQLGWELVFHRRTLGLDRLDQLARAICEAAADGISRLGVTATYRPRNDIEVDGRKISGTGGFFDGDTLFYQGTLLVDFDPDAMVAALNVPVEKLQKRALDSAAQRVVSLRQLLGAAPGLRAVQQALLDGFRARLGIEPLAGAITDGEEAVAQHVLDTEIGRDDFVDGLRLPPAGPLTVSASRTSAGGTLRAHVRLEGPRNALIREVLLSGDFFVTPPRLVFDLEAALRGAHVEEAGAVVDRFFASAEVGLLTITPQDFRAVVEAALKERVAPPA